MRVQLAGREVEMGGPYLDEMRNSNDLRHQPAQLRARLDEDGYLLIRGLQNREMVLKAREEILDVVGRAGALEAGTPFADARISSEIGAGKNIPGIRELGGTLGRSGGGQAGFRVARDHGILREFPRRSHSHLRLQMDSNSRNRKLHERTLRHRLHGWRHQESIHRVVSVRGRFT